MAQRISRAKQTDPARARRFALPPRAERADRLRRRAAGALPDLQRGLRDQRPARSSQRADLTAEAIRLTRLLHRLLPGDGEVAGLLALMLLTDARRGGPGRRRRLARAARRAGPRRGGTGPRSTRASRCSTRRSGAARSGPTSCRRRSRRCTTRRPAAEETDWPQILALYDVLERVSPGPVVTLNRAVAARHGRRPAGRPRRCSRTLDDDERMARNHRLDAVRAHLLELAGDPVAARESLPAGRPDDGERSRSSGTSRFGRLGSEKVCRNRATDRLRQRAGSGGGVPMPPGRPQAPPSPQSTIANARTGNVAMPRIRGGAAKNRQPSAGRSPSPVRCSASGSPARRIAV